MPRWEITVFGRVQGVGFRYHVKRSAEMLDVNGFVKNLPDGSVYIQAEAEKSAFESFCRLVEQGNSFSRVSKLSIEKLESMKRYNDFEIR
ncbi:MAG: acylphosphatase [Candidatus Cloacimonetes bacterium]|nr:acylphosphatase [Candidatus Cloacimonadota bacterium]